MKLSRRIAMHDVYFTLYAAFISVLVSDEQDRNFQVKRFRGRRKAGHSGQSTNETFLPRETYRLFGMPFPIFAHLPQVGMRPIVGKPFQRSTR